ncbi:MAG: amino acid adenylation domain-containing protein [Bacteroidales bacterium]|nr:amino acid adenylation domain-containing protein [Bacteroidales bacterium]
MKNTHTFFNKLRTSAGAIWLENDTIKLIAPKDFQNQETKDFILNNKTSIIAILNENQIFSKEKFLDIIILKDSSIKYYPLSPAQERLWFIEQYEGGTNAYHHPSVLELDSATEVEGIKYAIQQIVFRHEVLRSTIEQIDDQMQGIQVVHNEALIIEEITLNAEDYETFIKKDVNRPFDLSKEYPIRVKFYYIKQDKPLSENQLNKTILLINVHHIATDGWSVNIFQKELIAYYEAYINKNIGFNLPPLEIQYKDYAVWQRSFLSGVILEEQLNYWKSKLSGYQHLELPTDYARPNEIDYKGTFEGFMLDRGTSQKLRELAQRFGTTLHSVMLSSFGILLSKYTGQDDIVVGSPIANRHYQQIEDLIGFFVNTQANRIILDDTQSFESLIQQVHQGQVEAQLYQDLPFERLVEELGVQRDTSRHPIFQALFAVQSFGSKSQQKTYFKPYRAKNTFEVEKFDLSVFIGDSIDELSVVFSYATALFCKDTIERLLSHYKHLLVQLTEAPAKPYSQLSLLGDEEYQQILYNWSTTGQNYPKDKTIPQQFQEQAEKTPNKTALSYEGKKFTYQQLNEKSNQLARYIREQYQQKTKQPFIEDTPIAIYLDRSPEAVIGILAVLKAGGAYVPIDTGYPQDRVDYILEDAQTELVLSQRYLCEGGKIRLPVKRVLYIDLTEELYQREDVSNLSQHSKAESLAYVIYTSGTTGRPKGVMVEHRAILSLVYNNYIQVSGNDTFAFLSSPTFDATTFEVFTPLLNGNTLVIPKDVKNLASDIKEFKMFLDVNRITILWLTKTLFESLYYSDNTLFEGLNYLIIGGEALDKNTVNKLIRSSAKPKHFLNGYGPTESTTFACTYDMKNPIEGYSVPIGMPISNRSVYVLDRKGNLVPTGILGELHIGGAGLARGYLKHPDLTKERFIPNPFATQSDIDNGYTRLYRTGDIVRWLPNGNLQFIGRNDDQVKIRGFRIELGEIEHALLQISGIRQCCVLVKERKTEASSNKYLVAYYVLGEGGEMLTSTTILDKLSLVLPEYMMPNALVVMNSFPQTANGKLDRHALPDPDFSQPAKEYVAPTTELEMEVCKIWQEVLGLERVGITDNFFKIGGNSILAIQVSHRMSKVMGCAVRVANVFKYGCIESLLTNISHARVNCENVEMDF